MEPSPDSKAESPLPPLRRDLEPVPIEVEGKPMILLRDLEGLSEATVALSPAGMLLASLMRGQTTLSELRSAFAKVTGQILGEAEIQGLIDRLGRSGFLETEEVRAKRKQILEEFLRSPVRGTTLRGKGYPDNPIELATLLGKFFRDPKGPGQNLPQIPTRAKPPVGLIAPHIDLHRGGPAYAWAYGALAECPPPDLIVAVGVAHQAPNSPWTMTRKAYDTPYGRMEVSTEAYQEIRDALWYDPLDDEWAHRKEHSLEFQALWLKFLWRDQTPPWVPILASSFERFCPQRPPSAVETVEGAIREIGARLAKRAKSQRILILAGVDLAHVGPRFGDEMELGPDLEKRLEGEDRRSLDHAMKLEPDPFYLSVVADGHWRKVCGLSALYTSLRWIQALGGQALGPGRLLTYGQAPDSLGGIVSFASAIFQSDSVEPPLQRGG